jgi:hypothetical protein
MENKYYTPSIEEFHVGFECEILNAYYKWNPIKFTIGHYAELAMDNNQRGLTADTSEYRVKYLDREDIESLGFVFKGKSIDIHFEMEGSFDIVRWTYYKCLLSYGLHDQLAVIKIVHIGDEFNVFQGKIKNKSELKRLLQQLFK